MCLSRRYFNRLQAIEPGSGSEIQLTDALRHLLRTRPIYAYRFEGTRYDAGDKLGFLKATVEFALRRHDLGGPFREYLKRSCSLVSIIYSYSNGRTRNLIKIIAPASGGVVRLFGGFLITAGPRI